MNIDVIDIYSSSFRHSKMVTKVQPISNNEFLYGAYVFIIRFTKKKEETEYTCDKYVIVNILSNFGIVHCSYIPTKLMEHEYITYNE